MLLEDDEEGEEQRGGQQQQRAQPNRLARRAAQAGSANGGGGLGLPAGPLRRRPLVEAPADEFEPTINRGAGARAKADPADWYAQLEASGFSVRSTAAGAHQEVFLERRTGPPARGRRRGAEEEDDEEGEWEEEEEEDDRRGPSLQALSIEDGLSGEGSEVWGTLHGEGCAWGGVCMGRGVHGEGGVLHGDVAWARSATLPPTVHPADISAPVDDVASLPALKKALSTLQGEAEQVRSPSTLCVSGVLGTPPPLAPLPPCPPPTLPPLAIPAGPVPDRTCVPTLPPAGPGSDHTFHLLFPHFPLQALDLITLFIFCSHTSFCRPWT